MGDIILSVFMAISLGIAIFLSKVFLKYFPYDIWSSAFLLWFLMWSGFGFLAGIINIKNDVGILIAPAFFFIQTLASLMLLKNIKAGKMVLLLTLFLQIPILETFGFQYLNQTICSINIYFDWVNNFDIEPGSYLIFKNGPPVPGSLWIADGINLVPAIFIYLIQKIKARSND